MADVRAAMKSSMKKAHENSALAGIFANTEGSVIKVREGPAPGSTPNANTAGNITRPAIYRCVQEDNRTGHGRHVSSVSKIAAVSDHCARLPEREREKPCPTAASIASDSHKSPA